MNPTIEKIKAKFEEDPVATVGVAALAVTAAAKLIDSVYGARSKRAYARQINRRGRRY
jgi:hypothetical protein